jgi:hypothetical protein
MRQRFSRKHVRAMVEPSQIPLPPVEQIGWRDFIGLDSSDATQDIERRVSPSAIDMEVNHEGSLVRSRGTRSVEVFTPQPTQIALATSTFFDNFLVMFAPPHVGVRMPSTNTIWTDVGMTIPSFANRDLDLIRWANFGDVLVFNANINGPVYTLARTNPLDNNPVAAPNLAIRPGAS